MFARRSQVDHGTLPSQVKYLKKSIDNRWNTDLISAKAYLELHPHVEAARSQSFYKGPQGLSIDELQFLEDYVNLMGPINEVTILLSGEKYATG
jgi:hypothetical protein